MGRGPTSSRVRVLFPKLSLFSFRDGGRKRQGERERELALKFALLCPFVSFLSCLFELLFLSFFFLLSSENRISEGNQDLVVLYRFVEKERKREGGGGERERWG